MRQLDAALDHERRLHFILHHLKQFDWRLREWREPIEAKERILIINYYRVRPWPVFRSTVIRADHAEFVRRRRRASS